MSNDDIVPGFDDEVCDYLKIGLQKVKGKDNSLVLSLTGSIDAYNSDYLRRSARKVIDAGFVELSFILSGIDTISSSGVAAFISLHRMVKEKGGDITLVNMQPKVKGVFDLLCLETFFRCIDSEL